jgi:uncharacterized protein YqgV (UPF0045/DUF77 family)
MKTPEIDVTKGLKNYLLNGNFDLWQRSVSFSAPAQFSYMADRWHNQSASNTSVTILRVVGSAAQGLIPNNGFSLEWVAGSIASQLNIGQALENVNVIPLQGKDVTFSLYLRKSVSNLRNYTIAIQKNGTANTVSGGSWSTIASTVISTTSILTQYSQRFSVTARVPNDGTAQGLRVLIFDSGVGLATDALDISAAMLNIGNVLPPFATQGVSLGHELHLCQRYYELGSHGTGDVGNAAGTLGGMGTARFMVEKRANPTMTLFNGGNINQARNNNNGASEGTLAIGSLSTYFFQARSTTGLSDNVDYTFQWVADAEL